MRTTLALTIGLVLMLGVTSSEASIWFPPYWGLDAYTVWQPATVSVTIPTGYWYGPYGYWWGNYYWAPYYGWWYNSAPYYPPYLGWGAPNWYYGFTDAVTYSYTGFFPRTVYYWSRYWDPLDTGYTLDFISTADDSGAAAFDPGVIGEVQFGDHTWSINGGNGIAGGAGTGTFTPVAWVNASPTAIAAYLAAEGFDAATIADILDDTLLVEMMNSNFSGGVYGEKVIGIQWTSYGVPEPAGLALLALGAALVRRR